MREPVVGSHTKEVCAMVITGAVLFFSAASAALVAVFSHGTSSDEWRLDERRPTAAHR